MLYQSQHKVEIKYETNTELSFDQKNLAEILKISVT